MKIIIRAFVVALAVTGAIATTSANGSSAQATGKIAVTSAAPGPSTPGCVPGEPGCGFGNM